MAAARISVDLTNTERSFISKANIHNSLFFLLTGKLNVFVLVIFRSRVIVFLGEHLYFRIHLAAAVRLQIALIQSSNAAMDSAFRSTSHVTELPSVQTSQTKCQRSAAFENALPDSFNVLTTGKLPLCFTFHQLCHHLVER